MRGPCWRIDCIETEWPTVLCTGARLAFACPASFRLEELMLPGVPAFEASTAGGPKLVRRPATQVGWEARIRTAVRRSRFCLNSLIPKEINTLHRKLAAESGKSRNANATRKPSLSIGCGKRPGRWRATCRRPHQRAPCCRGLTVILSLVLVVLLAYQTVVGQTSGTERKSPRPGVKEVQIPFASLKPAATFRVGRAAD